MSYGTFARKESDAPALRSKAAPSSVSGGLRIGPVEDAYEREADRVAKEVMSGGAAKRHWSLPSPGGGTSLQRKCSCGASGGSGGECEQCKQEKEEQTLQRKAGGAAGSGVAPPIVRESLNSPGRPLDKATRDYFEPRFRHDFSRVRVHTDPRAAASARAVNAQAYTVGNDLVFADGRYAPHQASGRLLLAHELTHVVQQHGQTESSAAHISIDPSRSAEREADAVAEGVISGRVGQTTSGLQRMPISMQRADDICSGAGAKCAEAKDCSLPDSGTPAQGTSDSWTLVINIDIEASDFESALRSSPLRLGHTYASFLEGNGNRYTYGFYPASALPNENQRTVPGCVHHPDTTHAQCIDDRVMYSLNRQQFEAALAAAQKICKEGHTYGVSYTCTTYADEIVRAAGQSLPSSKSTPMTIYSQPVPAIDNPNTLYENVQEERKKDKSKQGPYWNNRCYNQCEADFNDCTKRGSGGFGLFGPVGGNVMQAQNCIIARNQCYQKCPKP